MRVGSRATAGVLAISVSVGAACFLLGRSSVIPAPLPPPAPLAVAAPSADLRAELESLRAALEQSEQRNAKLQSKLEERTGAMWDLAAEYWRQQGSPAPHTAVDMDYAWQRAVGMMDGGIFNSGENPEPWLFYEPFADGLAYVVEIARQGEAAVRFLESVVERPLPDLEPEVGADEEQEQPGEGLEEIQPAPTPDDGSEATEVGDENEDAAEERDEAERLGKEREAAIEFLAELASPHALDALLRLRKQFPGDPDLTLGVIRQHVERMPVDQIQPYLNRILVQCRETLNAGADDNQWVAVTAYLAFRHNLAGAMPLLRSQTLLDRDCVNGANIAATSHTEAAHAYLRWLAASSRDASTVEAATTQLANWNN